MKTILIFVAILFLLTATAAFTAEIESIETSRDTRTMPNISLYDPDPASIPFFNQHKVLVYSRTSRNGEQTDVVRPGNFLKECFVGSDHKIHVRRCGNVVYQIGVEDEVVIQNGRNGENGRNGDTGPQGPMGLKGDRGDRGHRGPVGPGTTVYNYSFGSTVTMSCQMGGAYAPVINSTSLIGVGLVPTSNISISNNTCVSNDTGVNIVNNNANTNTNANNNAINIGPGSATGNATGTGTSTAGN